MQRYQRVSQGLPEILTSPIESSSQLPFSEKTELEFESNVLGTQTGNRVSGARAIYCCFIAPVNGHRHRRSCCRCIALRIPNPEGNRVNASVQISVTFSAEL